MAKRAPRHDENEPPPHGDEHAPSQTGTGYNPFLKVEHVNAQGPTRLHLSGWVRRSTGQYGPQIIIEVQTPDHKLYDFAMKEGSPNHRMMWNGMGRDEKKWAGSIIVHVTQFQMRGGRRSNPAIEIREVESDNPPY